MLFKDYFKEQIKKIDNDEDGLLIIQIDGDVQFLYHKGCFADFQEDFCILYENDVNMSVRYDTIKMTQNATKEDFSKALMGGIIQSFLED